MFEHLDDPDPPQPDAIQLATTRDRVASWRASRRRARAASAMMMVLLALMILRLDSSGLPSNDLASGPTTSQAGEAGPPSSLPTTSKPFDETAASTTSTSTGASVEAGATTSSTQATDITPTTRVGRASSMPDGYPVGRYLSWPSGLDVTLSIDRTTIDAGGKIEGEMIVRNNGASVIWLPSDGGCSTEFGFVLTFYDEKSFAPSWRGGHEQPQACPSGPRDEQLEPGAEERWPMTFDSAMTYRDGKIAGGLPAGTFELWAGRRSCNLPDDCGVYWAKSIPVKIEW